jgi:DNA-binding PadR family transcriptional regulator
MSLRYALLGALAAEPRTGYALTKHFQQSLAYAWPASHSQIYPELARLRAQGLIAQREAGPRGAKVYELTEAGLADVRGWLRTEPSRVLRSEAALRTFFLWLLEPAEIEAHLQSEAEYARALLADFEEIKAEDPEPRHPKGISYRLALEHGIATARARLEWAEQALRERPWAAEARYNSSSRRGVEQSGSSPGS